MTSRVRFPDHTPVTARLRSYLVRMRDAFDGRMHRIRKDRAESRLTALRPQTVLFICLGNVCRSPYGARLLAAREPRLTVESAGFIGPDRPPPDNAQKVARARGVDHADHRSRLITSDLLEAADVIMLFDRFHVARLHAFGGAPPGRVFWLGDFDPVWSGKRAIIDPWGKATDEFDRTFERIERCIDRVVEVLGR